jgi:hypothetical protein
MRKEMYQALKAKYESEVLRYKVTVDNYFENPTAIGEHPDLIEEMDKYIEKLATAQGNLDVLKTVFMRYNK